MTILVLVNAKGGTVRDRGRKAIETEIGAIFRGHGAAPDIRLIDPRELVSHVRSALDSNAPPEAILVGGGDGSLSTAAGLLAGTETALGVLPLGTMNLFARGLGMPLVLADAVDALAEAKPARIDLLEVNGRPVLMHASIGLQPKIIRAREMLPYRTRLMRLTNGFIAWMRATRRLRPVRVTGHTRDGSFERSAAAILVSNNRLPSGFGETPVSQDLTRGEIALYICTSFHRSDLVRLALATSLGIWRESDLVEEIVTDRLEIASAKPNLLLSLDGELARLDTPLKFQLRERALKVLMPRRADAVGDQGNAEEAGG